MKLEYNSKLEKFGKHFGFTLGYLIFTSMLYLILNLLNKFPQNWTHFHIMAITITITIFGLVLKRLIK